MDPEDEAEEEEEEKLIWTSIVRRTRRKREGRERKNTFPGSRVSSLLCTTTIHRPHNCGDAMPKGNVLFSEKKEREEIERTREEEEREGEEKLAPCQWKEIIRNKTTIRDWSKMLAVPETDDDLVSSPSIESSSVVHPVDSTVVAAAPPTDSASSPQQLRSRLSLFHRSAATNPSDNTGESP